MHSFKSKNIFTKFHIILPRLYYMSIKRANQQSETKKTVETSGS